MKKKSWKSPLLLFLAAVIWGTAFVAQSVGMEHVGPFTFNCTRSFLGAIFLLLVIPFLDRFRKIGTAIHGEEEARIILQETGLEKGIGSRKDRWIGGICCGIALFLGTSFQQLGLQYTTVGKAGFITALYIVLVPVIGIFLHKKTGWRIWISVALAVVGLYLLCITDRLCLEKGDLLVLICAGMFAGHILVVDHFVAHADGVRLSCIQFFVSGILSGICMLAAETPHLSAIMAAGLPILYAGICSSGIAYTLQIVGQRDMNPTIASLILSLESVVSVISGWLLLGQSLSLREGMGCLLMFAAILLAQLV